MPDVYLDTETGYGMVSMLEVIIVTPADITLHDPSQQYTAIGVYEDASYDDLTTTVDWDSDTPAVITIDTNGLATAVAPGAAIITATYSGISGTANVLILEVEEEEGGIPSGPIEYVQQGVFYADEWQNSSDSMQVSVTTRDILRESQDNDLTNGIFWRDYSAGAAIADLAKIAGLGGYDIYFNDDYGRTILRDGPVQYLRFGLSKIPRVSITDWWARYWYRDIRTIATIDATLVPDYEVNKTTLDLTNDYPNGREDYWNARFESFVTFDYAETYTFYVTVDDGARLYVDGNLVVDAWRAGAATTFSGSYPIAVAGSELKVAVEYYQHSGPQRLKVEWQSPSRSLETIPSGHTAFFKDFKDAAGSNTVKCHQSVANVPSLVNSDPQSQAMQFNGSTSYALMEVDGIGTTSAVSIDFWAKITSNDAVARAIFDLNVSGARLTAFNGHGSGAYKLIIEMTGNSGTASATYNKPSVGETHHYCIRFDKTTNPDTITLWIDGALQAPTATSSADNTNTLANGTLSIGVLNGGVTYMAGIVDEFAIYPYYLQDRQITKHYKAGVANKIHTYPLLFAKDSSVWDASLEFATADIGMFYIDEFESLYYESGHEFYSAADNNHTEVQYTLSDDQEIATGSQPVQLQANSVTVKINPPTTLNTGIQSIWRASDNESLVVTESLSTLASDGLLLTVNSTSSPQWLKAGYLKIDNEIMSYSGITENSFAITERGLFDTLPVAHVSGSKVREVRVYDIEYSNAPAAFVESEPLILAREFDGKVDIDEYTHDAWKAHMVVSANTAAESGEVVMLEGTHPITELVYAFALAGRPVALDSGNQKVQEKVAANSANIRRYREKNVTIDNKFIQTVDLATEIASFVLEHFQDPVPILEVETMCIPHLQLGDRVEITSLAQFNIENEEYWVIGISDSYDGGVRTRLSLRKVS